MLRVAAGIFMVLHGLVHLLYRGQSARRFELQPGLLWPDGSWTLSGLLEIGGIRALAGSACLLAAAGFATGGAGIIAGRNWGRAVAVGAAVLSACSDRQTIGQPACHRVGEQGVGRVALGATRPGGRAASFRLQPPGGPGCRVPGVR